MEVYDAESFESEVVEAVSKGARNIIIDFSGLKYISSSGLRALINTRSQVEKVSGKLILSGLKDNVLEVFRVSKLLSIFRNMPFYGRVKKN
jgi:anti-anti-sigma factor